MKAENLMTRTVRTCSRHDSLEQSARVMWESDVGCLVVTDEQQIPIGMITDRDVAMAAYTQGVALRDARVGSAMSHRVWTCALGTPLSEVENILRREQIRRVPVVDSHGRLVGIVALADIAQSAQSSALRMTEIPGLARTLASITERRRAESVAAQ